MLQLYGEKLAVPHEDDVVVCLRVEFVGGVDWFDGVAGCVEPISRGVIDVVGVDEYYYS